MLEPTALTRDVLAHAEPPIPRFGTEEWEALPDGDMRQLAAILIAAECWRDHCSAHRVAEDLNEQLVRDDEFVIERLRRSRADVHEALPSLTETPWWARLAAAEKEEQADARRHFRDFETRNRRPT